jgi:predicted Rossmann fold flavoprotein
LQSNTQKNNPVNQYDVIVLGAGAAGLMAAITAASRNRSVLVVEKSNKIGKKILMSGGGKSNFTNTSIEFDNFISQNPHFCKSALSRYTAFDFIKLVEKHKIEYEERKDHQLFCIHSSKDIVNMLQKECSASGVEIIKDTDVELVEVLSKKEPEKLNYLLKGSREYLKKSEPFEVKCESLIVATGALSIPTLGGSDFGYKLAKQFALPLVKPAAGLVPFMFSDFIKPIAESLSGLSVDVEVSCQKKSFKGGLLFTHRGISGPAILQISNYWKPGQEIVVNLLPDLDASKELQKEKNANNKLLLRSFLSNHLSKSLVLELQKIWWPSISESSIQDISRKDLIKIGSLLNHWVLKPSSTEGYRTAEVTLWGVDTSSISSKTMEVNCQPKMYFIGEVLDVTGHLGGFNFQWAWSSGYCAGLVA